MSNNVLPPNYFDDKTIDAKWTALVDYVKKITSWPVIKARKPNTSQLKENYITIDLLSVEHMPNDLVSNLDFFPDNPDFPIGELIRGLCTSYWKISAYGTANVHDVLKRVALSFYSHAFAPFSAENQMGFMDAGEVRNISSVFLNSKYENRAEMTVSFYIDVPEVFDIDHFNNSDLLVTVRKPLKSRIEK